MQEKAVDAALIRRSFYDGYEIRRKQMASQMGKEQA